MAKIREDKIFYTQAGIQILHGGLGRLDLATGLLSSSTKTAPEIDELIYERFSHLQTIAFCSN